MSEGKLDERIVKLEQQVNSVFEHYQSLAEEHRLLKRDIEEVPRKLVAMNKLITLHNQKIKDALKNSELSTVKLLKEKKAQIEDQKALLLLQRAEWETQVPGLGTKLINAKTKHAELAQELATAKRILAQKTKETGKEVYSSKPQPTVKLFITETQQRESQQRKAQSLGEPREQRQQGKPFRRN